MNKLRKVLSRKVVMLLSLISIGGYGQKHSKTFKESFKVTDQTVLDIDTSHTDIEFETWNRSEIDIEATIELEDVSEEEAEEYFEKGGFEIIGNSKKVSISGKGQPTWLADHAIHGFDGFDFNVEVPDIPELEFLPFELEVLADLPEVTEVPPMPPMPQHEFDYEAFKKEGEKYLKAWQKEFSKDFNKDYEKRLMEWSERMEARREEMMKKREEMREKQRKTRAKISEKRAKQRAVLALKRAEQREKQRVMAMHRNKMVIKGDSTDHIFIHKGNMPPNIFYFSSDGEKKNLKMKKTIKIKMPKDTKIEMNVRHGEVKLAENTKNINASLSHASLWATTIHGDETVIMASYSPVSIEKWNYGQLQVNYSDHVDLKEVLNLRLSAISSDVVIDKLLKTAFIKNDLGPIQINSISNDFEELDVSLQNAEMKCELPSSSYTIYANGTNSKFSCPADLKLERTQNLNSFVHKGYHITKNTDSSIVINSKFSEVTLK